MRRAIVFSVLFLACINKLLGNSFADHRIIKMVPLTGKVVNDETKVPVVTKLTVITKGFSTFEVTTGSNGEFSTTIPESDKCEILVRAPGFESQDDLVELAPNAAHYIEIHLVPFVKLTLNGEVTNAKDKRPIKAELKVYHNSDFGEEDDKIISDGKYTEPLTNYGWYIIDFSAQGFVDTIDTLWVLSCNRGSINKNYQLTPIEVGLTIQLKNIYFNFGKSTLSSDSFVELDRIAELFNKNKSMQVEIGGHTDSDGPDDYNLLLSHARAQQVVSYLVNKGVNNAQLVAKGYGETKPIDLNSTQSGKANNRRVEMVIIKD